MNTTIQRKTLRSQRLRSTTFTINSSQRRPELSQSQSIIRLELSLNSVNPLFTIEISRGRDSNLRAPPTLKYTCPRKIEIQWKNLKESNRCRSSKSKRRLKWCRNSRKDRLSSRRNKHRQRISQVIRCNILPRLKRWREEANPLLIIIETALIGRACRRY